MEFVLRVAPVVISRILLGHQVSLTVHDLLPPQGCLAVSELVIVWPLQSCKRRR